MAEHDLHAVLDGLGIVVTTTEHAPIHTVEESRRLRGAIPGVHTKNLFLKDDKGALFLVVALSTTRVDLKQLAKRLGAGRFSFGKPELLQEVLGVSPGSVTAFAIVNDTSQRVRVVVDANLLHYETVNCHPLENTATTNIARAELLRFIRACGHEPRIAELGSAGPQVDPARG